MRGALFRVEGFPLFIEDCDSCRDTVGLYGPGRSSCRLWVCSLGSNFAAAQCCCLLSCRDLSPLKSVGLGFFVATVPIFCHCPWFRIWE